MLTKALFSVLLLTTFVSRSIQYQNNLPLIINDFLNQRLLEYATILTCETDFNMVQLSKELSKTTNICITLKNMNSRKFMENGNVTKMMSELLYDPQIRHTAYIMDVECPPIPEILKYISENEMFDETKHWLLFGKDLYKIKQLLMPLDVRLDSNVLFALQGLNSEDSWILYDFHNPGIHLGAKTKMILYGIWLPSLVEDKTPPVTAIAKQDTNGRPNNYTEPGANNCKEFKSNQENFQNVSEYHLEKALKDGRWRIFVRCEKITRRQDLQGITLNSVIAVTAKPKGSFMEYISVPFDVELDSMHRYNYILYIMLMDMYNFKMHIRRTNSWGYLQNGSWTGVVGFLVRQDAEISITPTQFKANRFHIIDQTAVTWLARPTMIFRHPSNDPGLKDSFTKPLAPDVWWATIAVLTLSGILFRIAQKHEVQYVKPSGVQQASEIKEDNSWNYTILLAIPGTIFQQGIMHNPTIFSGRTIGLTLLVFTFLLNQFYSASIVSSLLSESPRTILTLADILKSHLKVVIEDIPYNYDFFETTTDEVAISLYKKKVKPKDSMANFVSPEVGLAKVSAGGYAFQVDIATAYKIIPETFTEKAVCDLGEIQLFQTRPVIPVTRKKSPYRQFITKGFRRLEEVGIFKYQRQVWHYPRPLCPPSAQGDIESVPFNGVAGALVLLIVGGVIALFILFLERRGYYTCRPVTQIDQ